MSSKVKRKQVRNQIGTIQIGTMHTGTSRRPLRTSPPRTAGSLLDSTFKNYRISSKMREYSLCSSWETLVGSEFFKVTMPEKITRSKILVIRVLDASWAQEITLQKDAILSKLRHLPNAPAIEDIRFVVSGPDEQILRKGNSSS